jgi:hypothetical protein
MLAWAVRHPYLEAWVRTASYERKPREPRQIFGWGAFT